MNIEAIFQDPVTHYGMYLKPNNLLSQASSKRQMDSLTFPPIQQQLEATRSQWRWWFVVSQSILTFMTEGI